MAEKPLYPIFIKLESRKCLVVGGGKVAARKVAGLLESGASVTVIAPSFRKEIESLPGQFKKKNREYREGDEQGAFLVFACTDNHDLNMEITRNSQKGGALVNLVDSPLESDFFVPSKVIRDDLLIAVSTSGKAPFLAKRIRRELEEKYDSEYGVLVKTCAKWREQIINNHKFDQKKRREILEKLAQAPLLDWIIKGDLEKAEKEFEIWISRLSV